MYAACFLVVSLILPSVLGAQTHVVSPLDLQKQVLEASRTRQENIEKLNEVLSSGQAAKALAQAHVDSQQVKTAVSSLSDQELAQLASRASKAQADFAAGTLSDRDLLLVLIIVAVR
jgi:hypothetical protein